MHVVSQIRAFSKGESLDVKQEESLGNARAMAIKKMNTPGESRAVAHTNRPRRHWSTASMDYSVFCFTPSVGPRSALRGEGDVVAACNDTRTTGISICSPGPGIILSDNQRGCFRIIKMQNIR